MDVEQEGSVTISLVALSALTVGFTVLGYIALLLNRERYCVLQATQRTTVSKSQFPRHVMQYDGPDNNTYSIKLVEPQSFDDDLVAESGQQTRRDEEERTSADDTAVHDTGVAAVMRLGTEGLHRSIVGHA